MSNLSRIETPSPIPSCHAHHLSDSSSERGSRASMVCDVDPGFYDICRKAESRHRLEMKGWTIAMDASGTDSARASLYDIRALATRQY